VHINSRRGETLMKRLFFILFLTLLSLNLTAKEKTPQWWSLELKGGAWIPSGQSLDNFLSCCHAAGAIEFGLLLDSKWGFEFGSGFSSAGANGVGSISGLASQDRLNFLIIPIQNSFTFRADFKENQMFVPYAKVGPDYVFFRESFQGATTKGVKYGLHGAVGLQYLLEGIDDISHSFESDIGVNDIYLTLEGRYAWVNNFGASGLNLSNWMVSAGFLFEF
jgi:hypothetical protein